jgi:vacuolar protein sorting-associated protein 3
LHRHEEALHLLAHDLKDFQGAETYCYSGGTFETVKSLDDHAALQRNLFTRLLGEYLRLDDMSDRISQTVNLLDRWGRFFDVKMVIPLIKAILECGVDGVRSCKSCRMTGLLQYYRDFSFLR